MPQQRDNVFAPVNRLSPPVRGVRDVQPAIDHHEKILGLIMSGAEAKRFVFSGSNQRRIDRPVEH
ncbi:hypothetical protein, partial [Mesorhizobium sp. M7A.F.Ca.US.001.02.1.1]|uniref:hypothetical protein n=1 Tax=Mesorhizobium sp. M7A.F.Ca.US.001.02.1.1 TaxID=2496703 RepID=UPI0019D4EB30